MNYYELHIGDYEKATSHLTACEDGIYGRLLRRYYDTESPLPAEVKAVQRLVRARAKDEREAVETVLSEFFTLTADGWRHGRCDTEIAKYSEKRAKAKRSAEARWNQCERNANASADAMRTHSEGSALQSPDTNLLTDRSVEGTRDERAAPGGSFEGHVGKPEAPNPIAPYAIALNRAGFRCTAINPDLIAYACEGGTVEHLAEIAAHDDCAGKPAAYVIRFARREVTAAAKPITGAAHATARKLSASEQTRDAINRRRAESANAGG